MTWLATEASVVPSGEKQTRLPLSVSQWRSSRPVAVSQIWIGVTGGLFQKFVEKIVRSVDASVVPSGENARWPGSLSPPPNLDSCRPVTRSQSRIVLSAAPVATVLPSGASTASLIVVFPIPIRLICFPVATSQR